MCTRSRHGARAAGAGQLRSGNADPSGGRIRKVTSARPHSCRGEGRGHVPQRKCDSTGNADRFGPASPCESPRWFKGPGSPTGRAKHYTCGMRRSNLGSRLSGLNMCPSFEAISDRASGHHLDLPDS
ncbi:hypothetical protein SKAU_G00034040 [Synaphobranchus kaupii]|uniref:Uncharacterized protein n=1 Tax=Synaphobranchus kaupii TaxID=118154 RepID=A0A9Q1GFL2_SYNKA|nr:hypothetical protein SKAU_G00034040 [Synaphobranchus kaupii]